MVFRELLQLIRGRSTMLRALSERHPLLTRAGLGAPTREPQQASRRFLSPLPLAEALPQGEWATYDAILPQSQQPYDEAFLGMPSGDESPWEAQNQSSETQELPPAEAPLAQQNLARDVAQPDIVARQSDYLAEAVRRMKAARRGEPAAQADAAPAAPPARAQDQPTSPQTPQSTPARALPPEDGQDVIAAPDAAVLPSTPEVPTGTPLLAPREEDMPQSAADAVRKLRAARAAREAAAAAAAAETPPAPSLPAKQQPAQPRQRQPLGRRIVEVRGPDEALPPVTIPSSQPVPDEMSRGVDDAPRAHTPRASESEDARPEPGAAPPPHTSESEDTRSEPGAVPPPAASGAPSGSETAEPLSVEPTRRASSAREWAERLRGSEQPAASTPEAVSQPTTPAQADAAQAPSVLAPVDSAPDAPAPQPTTPAQADAASAPSVLTPVDSAPDAPAPRPAAPAQTWATHLSSDENRPTNVADASPGATPQPARPEPSVSPQPAASGTAVRDAATEQVGPVSRGRMAAQTAGEATGPDAATPPVAITAPAEERTPLHEPTTVGEAALALPADATPSPTLVRPVPDVPPRGAPPSATHSAAPAAPASIPASEPERSAGATTATAGAPVAVVQPSRSPEAWSARLRRHEEGADDAVAAQAVAASTSAPLSRAPEQASGDFFPRSAAPDQVAAPQPAAPPSNGEGNIAQASAVAPAAAPVMTARDVPTTAASAAHAPTASSTELDVLRSAQSDDSPGANAPRTMMALDGSESSASQPSDGTAQAWARRLNRHERVASEPASASAAGEVVPPLDTTDQVMPPQQTFQQPETSAPARAADQVQPPATARAPRFVPPRSPREARPVAAAPDAPAARNAPAPTAAPDTPSPREAPAPTAAPNAPAARSAPAPTAATSNVRPDASASSASAPSASALASAPAPSAPAPSISAPSASATSQPAPAQEFDGTAQAWARRLTRHERVASEPASPSAAGEGVSPPGTTAQVIAPQQTFRQPETSAPARAADQVQPPATARAPRFVPPRSPREARPVAAAPSARNAPAPTAAPDAPSPREARPVAAAPDAPSARNAPATTAATSNVRPDAPASSASAPSAPAPSASAPSAPAPSASAPSASATSQPAPVQEFDGTAQAWARRLTRHERVVSEPASASAAGVVVSPQGTTDQVIAPQQTFRQPETSAPARAADQVQPPATARSPRFVAPRSPREARPVTAASDAPSARSALALTAASDAPSARSALAPTAAPDAPSARSALAPTAAPDAPSPREARPAAAAPDALSARSALAPTAATSNVRPDASASSASAPSASALASAPAPSASVLASASAPSSSATSQPAPVQEFDGTAQAWARRLNRHERVMSEPASPTSPRQVPQGASSTAAPRATVPPPALQQPRRPASPALALPPPDRSAATPLPQRARRFLQPLLGIDPAQVRVYQGPQADRIAGAERADAVAIGEEVFLSAAHPIAAPQTLGLLAHELTHAARARNPLHLPPAAPTPRPDVGGEERLAETVEALASQRVAYAPDADLPPGTFTTAPVWPLPPRRPDPDDDDDTTPFVAEDSFEAVPWGGLPAPWEPLPDWSTPDAQRRSPDSRAVPRVPAPSFDPARSPALSPAPSAAAVAPSPASAAPSAAPPPVQRAQSGRGVAAAPAPPPPMPQQELAQPEPDLDALARQVYDVLKRRLAAERRRLGS
ncbi:MAG: hypothetical protein RLZZ387_5050 [Chloroflexota bacterium]